jgi:hygromycin-B 7''-O-kinase
VLPEVRDLESYRRIYRDERTWLPAMRAICRRHGLDSATLRLAPPGTQVVFWVGGNLLIKLFAPLWPADYPVESLVLRELAVPGEVSVPRIVAQGELEGWPYLVLTRLPGTPLDVIWGDLADDEKEALVSDLGRWMAAFHHTPTARLDLLDIGWESFLANQIQTCVVGRRPPGFPRLAGAAVGFLADLPP